MGTAYLTPRKSKQEPDLSTQKKKPIQLKSTFRYTPYILNCKDPEDSTRTITTLVGINSEVYIDGGGEKTGSSPYIDRNDIYYHLDGYVKGHIVNQKLGGPGFAENLFPFSAKTNRCHESNIECYAKGTYNDFIADHNATENFYYHCWLTGEAITKRCLDDPYEVNNIAINGEWYIIDNHTQNKREINARNTTAFDPDPDYE